MSNPVSTLAFVLRRVNHSEADRVITLLTEDAGRVTVYAKGVRKAKSKLAGGLELCMLSEVSFLPSKRSEGLATVTSARMREFFGDIVKDYDTLQETFALLKVVDKASEYEEDTKKLFHLSVELMRGLDKQYISADAVIIWFLLHITKVFGQGIELQHPLNSSRFNDDTMYTFDFDSMGFMTDASGGFTPADIKLMKLMTASDSPRKLASIVNLDASVERLKPLKDFLTGQLKQL